MRVGIPDSWDASVDVVVVGCGYAGAVAAIAAHDAGASVALFEKGPTPGGISICSAGGVRVSSNAEAALNYLRRTNGGTADDDLLSVLADGMARLPDIMEQLAARVNLRVTRRDAVANYPFEGHDSFGFITVDPIAGFDPKSAYPDVRGAPEGALLFQLLERNLAVRAIAPQLATPVRALAADGDGRVRGVVIEQNGKRRTIEACRGVVLASGGFEGSGTLQVRHWPANPVLNAAYSGNTGDGIGMAQSLGADVWHMFHYHGSYGFRHPDPAYPFGIRTKRLPDWLPGVGPSGDVRMPWILLDKSGRRFMNEYEPYMQDTGARSFDRYDPVRQDYAALPAWMVLDADGIDLWPLGRPTWHEAGVHYEWSRDNRAEIANGLLQQADDIAGLAKLMGIAEPVLAASLDRWNAAQRSGADLDWQRPASSMTAIVKPPFTLAQVWPIVSNTQGGPRHDARQRVVRPDNTPIPGLYAAGELGSVFGHLYMSGGNIAECIIGGLIAGREAALPEQ